MKIVHYIRLLLRNTAWLVLVPVICAGTVYWLTRNMQHEYISNTTLYTGVASGYSITGDDDQRIDYFAVNNAFDNLLATAKSRETLEQVALNLLSEHLMLTKPDTKVLGAYGFQELKKIAGNQLMTDVHRLKDTQSVFNYIESIYHSKADNPIARIIDGGTSFYSIDAIKAGLTISRINTSDMVQETYTCADPAVCMRTLELHSRIFISKYKGLKADQTNSAVEYFEKKLADVKQRLQSSEDELKTFGKNHQIINYYEQTRYIAQAKEEVDKELYRMREQRDASSQSLKLIESKLNSREKQITNSTSLMRMRQSLSAINADIEVANVYNNQPKVAELTVKKDLLEDSIRRESVTYNNLSYSTETVPRTDLIQQWVNNALDYDKANTNLGVLTNTRGNYLDEYSEFAPLGSTLKRLDRQIDINEQEFLSILHGLNLARLRQSSISLSSNLVVIDAPFFPLQAQSSKRPILIIAAFLAAFIGVVSVVVGRDMLDSSVKTPERAKKVIGLPLGGVSLAENTKGSNLICEQPLPVVLTEQLVNAVLPYVTLAIAEKGRAQVSLVTTRKDVYRSKDIELLHKQLSSLYKDAFWVVPDGYASIFSDALPAESFAIYKPGTGQLNYRSADELVNRDLSSHWLILYVTPEITRHALPTAIVKSSSAGLLVFDANHTWLPADRSALSKTRDLDRSIPFFTWLVNTSEACIDSIVGEIPKRRSWLRRKIKKAVTLNMK